MAAYMAIYVKTAVLVIFQLDIYSGCMKLPW